MSDGVEFPMHSSPFVDAIMSSLLHVRLCRPCGLVANVFVTAACALHGPGPQTTSAGRAPLEPVPQPPAGNVSYIAQTPSFALVASTETARVQAFKSLQSTAATFAWLFGSEPPQIGVVVLDTSITARVDALVMPAADLTTFTVTGGGLSGPDSVRSAAELRRELRFMAARTWLAEYALSWSAMLNAQGVHFVTRAGAAIPYARALPDWLHVSILRVLTEEQGLPMEVPENDGSFISVCTLFDYSVRAADAAQVERELRGPTGAISSPVNGEPPDASHDRLLPLFVWESVSVLRYLRAAQGSEALGNMFGALVGGMSMDDVVAHLPHPTTCQALDGAWHEWALEDERARHG